jgi:hypothetical protein
MKAVGSRADILQHPDSMEAKISDNSDRSQMGEFSSQNDETWGRLLRYLRGL